MPESNTIRCAPSIASDGIHDKEVTTPTWRVRGVLVSVSAVMKPASTRRPGLTSVVTGVAEVCLVPLVRGRFATFHHPARYGRTIANGWPQRCTTATGNDLGASG